MPFNSYDNFEALHAYLAENGAAIPVSAPPSEQNLEAISFTLTDHVDAEEEVQQESRADVATAYITPTETQRMFKGFKGFSVPNNFDNNNPEHASALREYLAEQVAAIAVDDAEKARITAGGVPPVPPPIVFGPERPYQIGEHVCYKPEEGDCGWNNDRGKITQIVGNRVYVTADITGTEFIRNVWDVSRTTRKL